MVRCGLYPSDVAHDAALLDCAHGAAVSGIAVTDNDEDAACARMGIILCPEDVLPARPLPNDEDSRALWMGVGRGQWGQEGGPGDIGGITVGVGTLGTQRGPWGHWEWA